MVRIVRLDEARNLGLAGRTSLEIFSANEGAEAVTLRYVEIPVPAADEGLRRPHTHNDCEECIHVLSGHGMFCTADGESELVPGDTVLVPPGELHVTRNTGDTPLALLCFFPVSDLRAHR